MRTYTTLLVIVCLTLSLVPADGLTQGEPPPVNPTDTAILQQLEVLDLETAQRIALANSPTLMAAAERANQAGERVKQAEAAYWPILMRMDRFRAWTSPTTRRIPSADNCNCLIPVPPSITPKTITRPVWWPVGRCLTDFAGSSTMPWPGMAQRPARPPWSNPVDCSSPRWRTVIISRNWRAKTSPLRMPMKRSINANWKRPKFAIGLERAR